MDQYILTLKENFIIFSKNNCEKGVRNSTVETSGANPIQIMFICLSVIALILNSFSLSIFWQQSKPSIMRITLILLSISETLFHSFMLLNFICIELLTVKYFVNETPGYWHLYIAPRISAITMVTLHVFISARNWCNLIISVSRTEAVLYPLKSRRLFRHSTIYVIYFFIITLAILFSILRHLDYAMIICTSSPYFVMETIFFSRKLAGMFSIIYFILQTGVPWVTVIFSTGITIIVLSKFHSDILLSNPVSLRNQKVAIRTVLLLAIIFSLCELPNLVSSFILNLKLFISYKFQNFQILEIPGNTLVILDSIFNFFVYAVSLPFFRRKLFDLFKCKICLFTRNVTLIYENINIGRWTIPVPSNTNFNQHVPILKCPISELTMS